MEPYTPRAWGGSGAWLPAFIWLASACSGSLGVSGRWLHGTAGNAARLPGQVAEKLRGRTFKSWDDFRETVWRTVAKDASLTGKFGAQSIERMKSGFAPFVHSSQRVGKLKSYALHHVKPLQHGGGVYDLDNIVIVTPRYHQEVLDAGYHY